MTRILEVAISMRTFNWKRTTTLLLSVLLFVILHVSCKDDSNGMIGELKKKADKLKAREKEIFPPAICPRGR